MGTGLSPILPVQICHSPYDVAALNNLYARARRERKARAVMSLTPSQQGRLANQLQQLDELASELEGQPEALLTLLRQLEQLHRSVQDGPFRSSLPADRGQLFSLLQSVERSEAFERNPADFGRTVMDLLQNEAAADQTLPAEETLVA